MVSMQAVEQVVEQVNINTQSMRSERYIAAIAQFIPPQINIFELERVVRAYHSGALLRSDAGLPSKSVGRPGQSCDLINHVTCADIEAIVDLMTKRSACPRPGLDPFRGWWLLCLDHYLGRLEMETVETEELVNGVMVPLETQVIKDWPDWPVPDDEDHATAWALCANLLNARMTAKK